MIILRTQPYLDDGYGKVASKRVVIPYTEPFVVSISPKYNALPCDLSEFEMLLEFPGNPYHILLARGSEDGLREREETLVKWVRRLPKSVNYDFNQDDVGQQVPG